MSEPIDTDEVSTRGNENNGVQSSEKSFLEEDFWVPSAYPDCVCVRLSHPPSHSWGFESV